MPPLTKLILVSVILITSLACVTLLGGESPLEEQPLMPPTPAHVYPFEPASCPLITNQIVEANAPSSDSSEDDSGYDEEVSDEGTYLVTYLIDNENLIEPYYYEDISSDLQNEQDNFEAHQTLWNYFASLIPYEHRPHLTEFSIFTDGENNTLAAVAQTYNEPDLWGLEVDIADTSDYYYLSFTLVHEFAHLLTLGPEQVPPSLAIFNNPDDNEIYLQELSACSTYFPGEGCSNRASYINQFYNQFWTEIHDEWNEINLEEDEDVLYEKLDDFYYQYEDQFLTDYAVTHPAEDIAESFGFFVFAEKPAGDTIAEQKILFFYQFPELVKLRTEILNNLCTVFPQ
ncbi:MAG: hypothetical protein JNK81_00425 [Anaerolineales bacterium]|nr:hypothetical protein [Anaerolineales bacterium]